MLEMERIFLIRPEAAANLTGAPAMKICGGRYSSTRRPGGPLW